MVAESAWEHSRVERVLDHEPVFDRLDIEVCATWMEFRSEACVKLVGLVDPVSLASAVKRASCSFASLSR